jgi:hypothetical protein
MVGATKNCPRADTAILEKLKVASRMAPFVAACACPAQSEMSMCPTERLYCNSGEETSAHTSAPMRDAMRLCALVREKPERTPWRSAVTEVIVRATEFSAPKIRGENMRALRKSSSRAPFGGRARCGSRVSSDRGRDRVMSSVHARGRAPR